MKVERVSHQVIENQMLASLSDKDKVALVLTEEEMTEVINCMEEAPWAGKIQANLLKGLKELRKQAFQQEAKK